MYEKLQKNTAQYIVFPLVDADGDFVTGATITGVYNYWEKGSAPQTAFIALTNTEVEIGATGVYQVQLTATETNHGYVAVMFTSATSKPQLLEYICVVGDPELLATTVATDAIKTDTAAILIDTDTMEADLKTYMDAIETNLDGDIATVKAETALIVEDTSTTIPGTITTMQGNVTSILEDTGTTIPASLTTIQADLDNPAQYKATGFSVPNEYDTVIASLQTDLDNPDQYKADVSGLSVFDPSTTPVEILASGGTAGINAEELVDLHWDEPLTGATHNVPTSSGRRLRTLGDTVSGSVSGGTPTSTTFLTTLTATTDDLYSNQYIRFIEGNLDGQVKIVGTYNSTTKEICICIGEPFSEAPADGDDFEIIPVHIHPLLEITGTVWEELIADHPTITTFGGKNQKVVPSETINDYKADVSGLAPANEYDTQLDANISTRAIPNEYDTELTNLQSDVTDIKAKTDVIPDDIETLLRDIAGLLGKHQHIDNYSFTSGKLNSCRIRTYNSKTNAEAHGATGLISTFTVTITWDDTDLLTYTVVKE